MGTCMYAATTLELLNKHNNSHLNYITAVFKAVNITLNQHNFIVLSVKLISFESICSTLTPLV